MFDVETCADGSVIIFDTQKGERLHYGKRSPLFRLTYDDSREKVDPSGLTRVDRLFYSPPSSSITPRERQFKRSSSNTSNLSTPISSYFFNKSDLCIPID